MGINSQIIEDNRTLYDSIGNTYPAAEGVTITTEIINNITCYWFEPENSKSNELVFYIHGGGYAIGSFQSHKAMVSHFAKGLDRTILFISYALAPEKPYPNGLNDILSVYEYAVQKFPMHHFYLFGDSAGGGLAIASVNEINKKNWKTPKAVSVISPWYNLESNNPSFDSRQHLDQILNKEMVKSFAYAYAGTQLSAADPSQLSFTTFPPVFIGVGTNEIMFDDAMNFFDMVYQIQPNSQLKIYGGEGHVLTQLNISSPAAQDLIMNIAYFFNNTDRE
ncbi:alpha/beta hydrolase [Chryseobacterium sp. ES2]|uniref:Alpha/beta hydrolase n=1 Tax=Chryseobacterium metallicongregator TaxID=3073042 RepID=A0ABU1E735_9FLAO|nr:alpha/beta hydrolase [Chryseobacterium sp. ES2]MDR4953630.1 alpha/beta hydrolase [Chryseobacterium sp. ES2]